MTLFMNGDFETQAELLEILINPQKIGFSRKTTSKLVEILELQFHEETISEVHGVTFLDKEENSSQLGLEVVRPKSRIEVEDAIKLFRNGDYSKIKLLADYANTACSSIEGVMELPPLFRVTRNTFNSLVNNAEKLTLLKTDLRDIIVDSYLEILKSYVSYYSNEIIIPRGFLGFFHCHRNGTEPSLIDLNSTVQTGVPEVVISAREDYKISGVTIYLCFKGNKTYQESLMPFKKQ